MRDRSIAFLQTPGRGDFLRQLGKVNTVTRHDKDDARVTALALRAGQGVGPRSPSSSDAPKRTSGVSLLTLPTLTAPTTSLKRPTCASSLHCRRLRADRVRARGCSLLRDGCGSIAFGMIWLDHGPPVQNGKLWLISTRRRILPPAIPGRTGSTCSS